MSKTHHLIQRDGIYFYNRRVPRDLIQVVGSALIRKSLGTNDKSKAIRLRNLEEVKIDALFGKLRRQPGEKVATQSSINQFFPSLPAETLIEQARRLVERLDAKANEDSIAHPIVDDDELFEVASNLEHELTSLLERRDPMAQEWIDGTADRILRGLEHSGNDHQTVNAASNLAQRALVELDRRKLDRLHGRFGRVYYDSIFDPRRASNVTFAGLCEVFIAERDAENQHNGVSKKWADKIRSEVVAVSEIIGKDRIVGSIDDDVIQAFRKTLAELPAHRTKRFSGLSLSDAIARNNASTADRLAGFTQKQYMSTLREILRTAVRKKFLAYNPADGVQPLVKDVVAADKRRLPWSQDQIVGFFTGKFYQGFAPESKVPYAKPDREWRFWLPLIMLLTGARPNEIAQLLVDDVQKTTSGTWFLDICETDEDDDTTPNKTIKTRSSRRKVPIHPELIKIGFLHFVTETKAASKGNGRLFPTIKPDKYGNFATYPTRRFRETFIPAEITLDERQTLYSLRHNVRDALRHAQASDASLLAVTGWSPHGKAISDNYGDPGNPDFHASVVAKIAYPGLDQSFLHNAWGPK